MEVRATDVWLYLHLPNINYRQHVARDLTPYTCIFENCETPLRLYSTAAAWSDHINKTHRVSRWTCEVCDADIRAGHKAPMFDSAAHLSEHLKSIHPSSLTQIKPSAKAMPKMTDIDPMPCPLCNNPNKLIDLNSDDHIAEHIHAFSLQALPWGEEDMGQGFDVVSSSASPATQPTRRKPEMIGNGEGPFDDPGPSVEWDAGSLTANNDNASNPLDTYRPTTSWWTISAHCFGYQRTHLDRSAAFYGNKHFDFSDILKSFGSHPTKSTLLKASDVTSFNLFRYSLSEIFTRNFTLSRMARHDYLHLVRKRKIVSWIYDMAKY